MKINKSLKIKTFIETFDVTSFDVTFDESFDVTFNEN